MDVQFEQFGTLLSALNAAGIQTGSARGSWGGVTRDGDIVATAWTDHVAGKDRFSITRPKTRHGGLRDAWDLGRIEPGATIRLILVRQRGDLAPGVPGRMIKDAALMPGRWRVIEVRRDEDDRQIAIIEKAATEATQKTASDISETYSHH